MTYPIVVRPGQRATADVLNGGFMPGTIVFAAYRDASQNISAGQTTGQSADALAWDSVPLDLLGGWAAGQPTRYTPPIPGRYLCAGAASFQQRSGVDSGVVRGVTWRQNGSASPGGTARTVATGWPTGGQSIPVVSANTLSMVFNGSSDYVELCPCQDSTTALGTAMGSSRPYITVTYVGTE